ncbi:MAG: hypothetical protein ACP5VC_05705 [Bryobacteraceae bacterium]
MALGFPVQPEAGNGALARKRALLDRIAASAGFRKSQRARELLEYLARRSLDPHGGPVREQEIGVAVFGRPPGYDTSQDTLVRVQASHLRKKLEQYFEEEGREETLRVRLPKGSYTLEFFEAAPQPRAASCLSSLASRPAVAWWVAAILAATSVLLLWQNQRLGRRLEAGIGPHPEVDRLWRQMFDNGRPTFLLLSDLGLLPLANAIQHDIPLEQYQNRGFTALAEREIADPVLRSSVLDFFNRYPITMADAAAARRFGLLFSLNSLAVEMLSARDANIGMVSGGNVILLGSRRGNPWVGAYEEQLNFQTVFTEPPRRASFRNTMPLPGEQPEYPVEWGRIGYCRVAYLPSLKPGGTALLISGTDVNSSDAGVDFITRESSVTDLRRRLGAASGRVPHFEVLLKTYLACSSVARYELLSVRRK